MHASHDGGGWSLRACPRTNPPRTTFEVVGGIVCNNLNYAVRIARRLGATVGPIRRTGEIRFWFPGLRPLTHNARRKDSSRALRGWLRDLEQLCAGGSPRRSTRPRGGAC